VRVEHAFQFVVGSFDGGGNALRSLGDGGAFLPSVVPEPAGVAVRIVPAAFVSLRRPRRGRTT
jgi:hypothetical protein